MRYIIPGLIFYIQIIFVFLLNPEVLEKLLEKFDFLLGYGENNNVSEIGVAILAFFTSGVLGFLASNFYYIMHWKWYINRRFSKLDYKKIVEGSKSVEILGIDFNSKTATQQEAWSIMNVLWKFYDEDKAKGYDETTDRVSNVVNGIGTSITIMIIGLFLSLFLDNCCQIVTYLVVNILIIILLWLNYQISADILQNLYKNGYNVLDMNIDKYNSVSNK